MSVFLKHIACPKCGPEQDRSGNNLGVFSDGHLWCFACGYWQPPTGVINLDDVRQAQQQKERSGETSGTLVILPPDSSPILPTEPLNWLRKYGLSDDEIAKHKLVWSPMYHRLIFPVFDDIGNVLMWQGRYFPELGAPIDVKKPRYYTKGKPEQVDAYYGHIESSIKDVVVVEDAVSAIKVSRVCPTLCLWGCEISLRRMKRMAMFYERLVIWLDPDKAHHSVRCSLKARPYFEMVSTVLADKDPKDFSTEEIKKWISR